MPTVRDARRPTDSQALADSAAFQELLNLLQRTALLPAKRGEVAYSRARSQLTRFSAPQSDRFELLSAQGDNWPVG